MYAMTGDQDWTSGARPRILVVLHQEHSTPGRVGRLLEHLGYSLDVRRPCHGDLLPESLDGHAGAVFFGGPMSANDADEFVRREIDWLELPLRSGKPYLGLCLGAQMLAKFLGARVASRPDGRVERGWYEIAPTPAGASICSEPFPRNVYQWHCEGFDLPAGATPLAAGDLFPVQAMRYGAAFGLQFHPEVTYAMLCRWSTKAERALDAPYARPAIEHRADWFRYDAMIDRWIAEFLRVWISQPALAKPPALEVARAG